MHHVSQRISPVIGLPANTTNAENPGVMSKFTGTVADLESHFID